MEVRIRLYIILVFCLMHTAFIKAESWDYIRNSGEYYYGVGVASSEAEADQAALANLVSQIATHVSSDFNQIDDITAKNGEIDHTSRVLNCVKTYSQATLTNTEKWVDGKAPNITVRRYMKKSELARIFEDRIVKAKNMLQIADECLEAGKVDMALQYYYWAYSLLRSTQFPNEVKDEKGKSLVDWIPIKIENILRDISVRYDGKDDDTVNLFFTYKGEPVSSLEFSYSDGRSICQGLAKGGYGIMEMLPGYDGEVCHIDIEYQYKNQARGDAEMESVLQVITPKVFPKSSVQVKARSSSGKPEDSLKRDTKEDNGKNLAGNKANSELGGSDDANTWQITDDAGRYRDIIRDIVKAISTKRYSDANIYFTPDGLQMFNRLISYGRGRIIDDSEIKYYKGLGGGVVARGLRMSFSFEGRRKKTFVEDVGFSFNEKGKIDNVAFGLGKTAEEGIYNSRAKWPDEVREIILSFMENYKTAYSLERLDYIQDIFAEDAIIIVGNKIRRRGGSSGYQDGRAISLEGQDIIKYNRYTKKDYIDQLRKCFFRNDFINLKFTNHEIQWLEKFDSERIFAINIRQEYDSSTYSDDGYLFLLVDITNQDEPLIKVRTWQPNEVAMEKLYNAGDFFNE